MNSYLLLWHVQVSIYLDPLAISGSSKSVLPYVCKFQSWYWSKFLLVHANNVFFHPILNALTSSNILLNRRKRNWRCVRWGQWGAPSSSGKAPIFYFIDMKEMAKFTSCWCFKGRKYICLDQWLQQKAKVV